MKIYEVEFKGMWPVGNCLIIAANNDVECISIATDTITHTNDFKIKEVDISKPGVICYLSGDY